MADSQKAMPTAGSRTSIGLLLLALAGLAVGISCSAVAGESDEGFQPIFNGKDLSGWDGDPRFWSVEDGVIRGQTTEAKRAPHNTFLIWRGGTLADFELRLKFRVASGNSGVQVRSKDLGQWRVSGYQAEVAPSARAMGLFYDEAARGGLATCGQRVVIDAKGNRKVVDSLGDREKIQAAYKEKDWNEYAIIGRGNRLTQAINGVVFSEVTDEEEGKSATTGILALQIHAGPPMVVEFKDLRLKTLADGGKGVALFNGKDLTGWKVADQADFITHGKVYVEDGKIRLEEGSLMTGIQWASDFPKSNYEVSLEAMRVTGFDFFCGLTFSVGDSHCTLIVGGWGGMVVGLSNVDGMNASENMTSHGRSFDMNRWYRIRVRVTDAAIQVWIDDERIIDLERKGHTFSVWEEQSPLKPFGVSTWMTGSALRNITLRKLAP